MPAVLVDFDGTISPCHYPLPLTEPPRPECITLLRHLRDKGIEIVLWSARANEELPDCHQAVADMEAYMQKYLVPYDRIQWGKQMNLVGIIDDRAIAVRDQDWYDACRELGDWDDKLWNDSRPN